MVWNRERGLKSPEGGINMISLGPCAEGMR